MKPARLIFAFLIAIQVAAVPSIADASVFDAIYGRVSGVISKVGASLKSAAIGASQDDSQDSEGGESSDGQTDEDSAEDTGGDSATMGSAEAGMCRVPQEPPETVCELGAGFLCVNTPDKGVAEDSTVIKGTVDRSGSVVTSVSVVVQHEYTKETVSIDTSDPETGSCWESTLEAKQFCLDDRGYFSARVPLSRLGPYTVSVSAGRLSGVPMEQSVRLSKVIAPTLSKDAVSFDPDISSGSLSSGDIVNVTVGLIGDCKFCDFIGASTGAVSVTVENTITASDGAVSHVSCSSKIEQGGQGRYLIGVPVGDGSNSLKVTVCNAAVAGECPSVSGVEFSGPRRSGGFEIVSPTPLPSYDSKEYPEIDWKFQIEGASPDSCVNVQFNRDAPKKLCAEGNTFGMRLKPVAGINVATVELGDAGETRVYPWTFGWGSISAPFNRSGKLKVRKGIEAKKAVQISLPAHTLTKVLQPIIANFLTSDAFGEFLVRSTSKAPATRSAGAKSEAGSSSSSSDDINEIKDGIEGCEGGGSMGGKTMEIVGSPKIGKAKIEGMRVERDRISFTLNVDDVEVRIRYFSDGDKDSVPDGVSLPLLIAFRKALFDIEMTKAVDTDGRALLLISAPHTDCDYKVDRYCTGASAALIPKNFVGSATHIGGFVRCDGEGQSEDTKELCNAVNSLNAQTGLMSEKVLDALNGMLYCTGSAVLTNMFRGGSVDNPIRVGCFSDDPEDKKGPFFGCSSGAVGRIFGPWLLSAGVDLGDGLEISSEGVLITTGLRVGNADLFESFPDELKLPSVGVAVDPDIAASAVPISRPNSDGLMSVGFSTNALNHLFFLLTEQSWDGAPSGVLDLDLSEPFFAKLDFDFVKACDETNTASESGKERSPLCNMRPRVGELLGSSLTSYKYFAQNYPVMMSIRGNRALPPHIKIVKLEDIPVVSRVVGGESGDGAQEDAPSGNLVDLQLGGVTLSFYALEIDESKPKDQYGNSPLRLDENGDPIIKSMRPEDTDPYSGQIISFDLTLLLAMELGEVETDPDDPSRFILKLRPLANRSRLVLAPVAGSNSTTVPPEGLVSALREKLSYAISIFSAPEKAIKIRIPKIIALSPKVPVPDSLMSMMGLKDIMFSDEGLRLEWDEASSYLTIDIAGTIRQIIEKSGETVENEY